MHGRWVRWLPANLPAGGYLTIINHGDTAVRLLGASSNDYANVAIHQTHEQAGSSQMTDVRSPVDMSDSR